MSTSSAGQRLTRARSGVGVAGPGSLEPRKRRRPGASPVTLMLFAAPSLFLLLLINLYPVIYAGWQSLRDGLPQQDAFDLVYRHGLDVDSTGTQLAMGSTTGALWTSDNAGERWSLVNAHLPPIYAVRFA